MSSLEEAIFKLDSLETILEKYESLVPDLCEWIPVEVNKMCYKFLEDLPEIPTECEGCFMSFLRDKTTP